jgi:hypothetical protein
MHYIHYVLGVERGQERSSLIVKGVFEVQTADAYHLVEQNAPYLTSIISSSDERNSPWYAHPKFTSVQHLPCAQFKRYLPIKHIHVFLSLWPTD